MTLKDEWQTPPELFEKLNDELDGLPENHVHCTVLAVNTLKKTIEKLIDKEKNSR